MTRTKSHHYSHRAGGLGWAAPHALSVAVHNLKSYGRTKRSGPNNTHGGEWAHAQQHGQKCPLLAAAHAATHRSKEVEARPLAQGRLLCPRGRPSPLGAEERPRQRSGACPKLPISRCL